jgi:hypothetical protein
MPGFPTQIVETPRNRGKPDATKTGKVGGRPQKAGPRVGYGFFGGAGAGCEAAGGCCVGCLAAGD